MGTHAQNDASSEKMTFDQSRSRFSAPRAFRFSIWVSESRGFCLVLRYFIFNSTWRCRMVFILILALFSARIALASHNRRVEKRTNSFMIESDHIQQQRASRIKILLARCCSRFASLRQIVDCFICFITLNPLLHERFRLFDVFSSGCIGHKWSLWMGTQEDRFKTFRVHRTHYGSRLLSRTIRALLNRLGNCAVVLWMYFH